MTRFISTSDIARLEAAYAQHVEKIFFSIFTLEWLDAYYSFCEYAIKEKKDADPFHSIETQDATPENETVSDPTYVARCFFLYAWKTFKTTCSINNIIVGSDHIQDLLESFVPGYELIWKDLVDMLIELEDFRKMARNQILDFLRLKEAEKLKAKKSVLAGIGILVDSRLSKTMHSHRPDITETHFTMEINGLIDEIVAKGLYCSAEELREILKVKVPTLTYHLLLSVNRYETELLKNQPPSEAEGNKAQVEFDVSKIISQQQEPCLEPIECVVSIDPEKRCFYIRGEEFGLDYKEFNRGLHMIMKVTPPIFYQKRLNEFLDILEDYSLKTGSGANFAEYVLRSYRTHQKKQMEVMNSPGRYEVEWEIRFPILVAVLMMRHTKHIDERI